MVLELNKITPYDIEYVERDIGGPVPPNLVTAIEDFNARVNNRAYSELRFAQIPDSPDHTIHDTYILVLEHQIEARIAYLKKRKLHWEVLDPHCDPDLPLPKKLTESTLAIRNSVRFLADAADKRSITPQTDPTLLAILETYGKFDSLVRDKDFRPFNKWIDDENLMHALALHSIIALSDKLLGQYPYNTKINSFGFDTLRLMLKHLKFGTELSESTIIISLYLEYDEPSALKKKRKRS